MIDHLLFNLSRTKGKKGKVVKRVIICDDYLVYYIASDCFVVVASYWQFHSISRQPHHQPM